MTTDQSTIIENELYSLKNRIIQNHVAAGQKASGKTIDSLKIDMTETGGALLGRSFFGVMETGRKPGKIPTNFIEILEQWIIDKGIDTDDRKSLAAHIASNIANEGSLLFREGGRSDIYSNEIPKSIDTITQQLGDNFLKEVSSIFEKTKQYKNDNFGN